MKNILSAYRIAIPICTALALAPSVLADDSKKSAAPAPVLVPQLVNTLDPQTQLRFSPDESLAISMHREQLHMWDLKTGTLLRVLAQPQPGEAFENERIAFVYAGDGLNVELIDTERRAARLAAGPVPG